LDQLVAGRVAARPGEAGDKTKLDRVFIDAEDRIASSELLPEY
jgi:hypothetical protein